MTTPYECPDCGQTHTRGCKAHKSQARGGTACQGPAMVGLDVCCKHGGRNPRARAKSERAKIERAANAAAVRFGAPVETTATDALVDLITYQAGIVAYWRGVVERIANGPKGDKVLVWGKTKVKDGGDDGGVTYEAKPHIAYVMLDQAQARLAEYATAALRAGVEERRVQIAEREGALLAGAIRAILDALHLTAEQLELVPKVVPAQLRLLGGVS